MTLERPAQRLASAFASEHSDVTQLFEEALESLTHSLTATQRGERK
jgi:hypothetical protein